MISNFIAAMLAATAPLPANQAPRAIAINGGEAIFVRSVAADGTVILDGEYRMASERTPFRYRVKGARVRAVIGGERYAFRLPAA